MIFNRFAKEARRYVVAAVEEARVLGHDSVGDEDLLLGIVRSEEGIAAQALSSLGVTLEGARQESEEMLSKALSSIGISLEDIRREAGNAFEMSIPDNRRIPFSPRAKKALERALSESVRLRDGRIGTEHVMLGILRDEEGMAVRMLTGMGVSAGALEDRLFELRGLEAG
jgi:ATP-dependent Clp protease ATP-binding subunit ClpA